EFGKVGGAGVRYGEVERTGRKSDRRGKADLAGDKCAVLAGESDGQVDGFTRAGVAAAGIDMVDLKLLLLIEGFDLERHLLDVECVESPLQHIGEGHGCGE